MNRSEHQKNVQRALEGNERVWFHPEKEMLAVWKGGPRVHLVSSVSFKELDVFTVRAYDDMSKTEDAVCVELARRGFDRCGRTQDDTRVVEA